jgi:hypothetical protein
MILGKPRPKPTNLAEWLEQAIGDLVPSAQARVRPEIAAHYAEAVQMHLAGGLTEPAAHASALADLGDAAAAARRFGREYVTTEDISRVARWTGPFKVNGFGTVFWFLMITNLLTPDPFNVHVLEVVSWEWVALLFLVAVIYVPLRALVRVGRKTRLQAGRQIIMGRSISWLLFGALWITNNIVLRPLPEPLADWAFSVAIMACTTCLSLRYLRLRQKLVTAHEDDLPPSDSATASNPSLHSAS